MRINDRCNAVIRMTMKSGRRVVMHLSYRPLMFFHHQRPFFLKWNPIYKRPGGENGANVMHSRSETSKYGVGTYNFFFFTGDIPASI